MKIIYLISFLLLLHFNSTGQAWTKVKLDSIATIEFPVEPRSMDVSGAKRFDANYLKDNYGVTVAPLGFSGNSPKYRDRLYKSTIKGCTRLSKPESVIIKDFYLNELVGKDVVLQAKIGSLIFFVHERIMLVNGTTYIYSYSSKDSIKLFSEPTNRFLNSFSVDTTINLVQYGPPTESDFVKKLTFTWLIVKVILGTLIVSLLVFIIMRFNKSNAKPDSDATQL